MILAENGSASNGHGRIFECSRKIREPNGNAGSIGIVVPSDAAERAVVALGKHFTLQEVGQGIKKLLDSVSPEQRPLLWEESGLLPADDLNLTLRLLLKQYFISDILKELSEVS